jgi:anti-sigma factor RsiW
MMALSTMSECEDVAPLIGAFQDGELPVDAMKKVAHHLAVCKTCEAAQASYSSIGRILRETTPEPDLSGFTSAVQTRIAHIHVPLRTRLGRWLGAQRERFGGAPLMAFAMAAAAIATVLIVSPLAHNFVGAGHDHSAQVVANTAQNIGSEFANAPESFARAMTAEPTTIISKLETSNPDVAVWSEPTQDTTVIWLPDQQR